MPFKDVSFSTSQKGGQILHYQDYEYRKHRVVASGKKTHWKCRLDSCKARLHTTKNNEVIVDDDSLFGHNHQPDLTKQAVQSFVSSIKEDALNYRDAKPQQVLENNLRKIPESVRAALPDEESLKRTIWHARAQAKMTSNEMEDEDFSIF